MELQHFNSTEVVISLDTEELSEIVLALNEVIRTERVLSLANFLGAIQWLPLVFGELPPDQAAVALAEARSRQWHFSDDGLGGVWVGSAQLRLPPKP